MGFLQNYLGLEPAYKDGYDLPLLGMCLAPAGDEPPPTGIADRVHSNVLVGTKTRALVRGAHP